MTFSGMAWWQAWILVAAAGAAAAWLFRMKLRPPRVPVSSLLLWRRVLDEPREQTLWERIRRAVSMVLTIAIAIALAFAIARPSPSARGRQAMAGRMLIVIDSSWSMLARTSDGGTRWSRAIAEARRLASGSGDAVALATTADGLVEGPTTDLTLIESALDRIAPSGGEGTAWPELAGVAASYFITDGALTRALDPSIAVRSVFESADNVAITAFESRPALSGDDAGEAYLEISNFTPAAQQVQVTVARGDTTLLDREVGLGAGETLRQTITLQRGPEQTLRARIRARRNALPIDDEAVAWIEQARPVSVAVVGEQTAWLRALLEQDPGVTATFVAPAGYRPGQEDVTIFDRCAPPARPARPALLFAPPAGTVWLQRTSAAGRGGTPAPETRPRWEAAGTHPVVRGVDPFTLTIEKAYPYESPGLSPVAQSVNGTPLVYVSGPGGSAESARIMLMAFSAAESSLASAPGFPVLVGNALAWLTHPIAAGTRRPGPMHVDGMTTSVIAPGGAALPLVRLGQDALVVLPGPGLYVAQGGGARSAIPVNVGDPQSSNLARSTLTGSAASGSSRLPAGRPWWWYFAVAAFALTALEWWTWQRRITV